MKVLHIAMIIFTFGLSSNALWGMIDRPEREKFFGAIFENNVGKLKELIKNNPRLVVNATDDGGSYSLHRAVEKGKSDVLKTLLQHFKHGSKKLEMKDADNNTPLMRAIEYANIDAVKQLIGKGAKVNKSIEMANSLKARKEHLLANPKSRQLLSTKEVNQMKKDVENLNEIITILEKAIEVRK